MDKVWASAAEAVADLPDGASSRWSRPHPAPPPRTSPPAPTRRWMPTAQRIGHHPAKNRFSYRRKP
jgi:hypothetical protein